MEYSLHNPREGKTIIVHLLLEKMVFLIKCLKAEVSKFYSSLIKIEINNVAHK